MIIERCHRSWQRIRGRTILALTVCVLSVNAQFCRGSGTTANRSAVHARIFTLNNISAQTGRDYLKKLAIGETVLPIPGTKALSVTGESLELVRAATVLSLVDSEKKYLIKKITLKDTDNIPNHEELSRKLAPAISIGSLIIRPAVGNVARAIVDRQGDELVIIAAQQQLPEIIKAIKQFKDEDIIAAPPAQAVDVPMPAKQLEPQQSRDIVTDVNQFLPEMTITEQPDKNNPKKSPADNTYRKMQIPNGDDPVNIDLPEKLEIVQLIDIVGKLLNLDYLYDETKIKGNVTVKIQGKMKVKDLYELLENVLQFKGFVMSRSGNLVTIVPEADALETDPVFSKNGIRPGDVVVTRVFPLNYITTAAAKKVLTEMKLGTNINEIPESGTLIITEFAFRMSRIEQLLQLVDIPGKTRIFKLRELRYTLATALVPKLKEMAEKLGSISITIAAPTPARSASRSRGRRPVKPKRTTATEQKSEVYIDYDERTNRVLMIGHKDEIATVEKLIDALDVPQQDLRTIHEYKIKYVGIEDVVDALQKLGIIGGSKKNSGLSAKKNSPVAATSSALLRDVDEPQVVQMESANSLLINATPEQHIQITRIISYVDRESEKTSIPYRIYRLENQEPKDLADVLNNLIEKTIKDPKGKIQKTITREEDIAIIADQKTFSIIVYASKKNQEWIGELIKALDIRRPQVLIDVSLVEITRNDQFTYDLNLLANARRAVTGSTGLAGAAMTAVTGDILEGGYDKKDKKLKGFYSSDNIQALLTMITTKGYGRVLAQPKILVNDSEEGTIETSQKTYVAEDTLSYPAATSTGSPIPVTTVTWKDYNARINLTITPQIGEGDLLRLTIKMVREDFGKGEAGAPPDLTTSNVNTVVTVPDGSTIILGGLNKLNQSKSGSKIPFLGDLPLAGGLFRSVDNSNIEKRLYIFVKANILRPDTEEGLNPLRDISRKNKAAFEKAENDFQTHKDFPGIEPTVFEPRRVLEQMDKDVNTPDKKVIETGSIELKPVLKPAKPAETGPETIDSLELLQEQQ